MHYNKLVRDKIPEILDAKGVSYEKRIASDTEYRVELIKKLQEEAEEFAADSSPEELADVIEVIEVLKKLPEFSDVEIVRLEKREKRGGFDKQIILKGRSRKLTKLWMLINNLFRKPIQELIVMSVRYSSKSRAHSSLDRKLQVLLEAISRNKGKPGHLPQGKELNRLANHKFVRFSAIIKKLRRQDKIEGR